MATDTTASTTYSNDLARLARDNPSGSRLAIGVMRLMDRYSLRFPDDNDFLEGYGDFLVWPRNVLALLRCSFEIPKNHHAHGDDDEQSYSKEIAALGFDQFHARVLSSSTRRQATDAHDRLQRCFRKYSSAWPAVVKATLHKLNGQAPRSRDPATQTVELLARLLDLAPAEKNLLQYLADRARYPIVETFEFGVRSRSRRDSIDSLAVLLGESSASIRKALIASSSRLLEFGVVELEKRFHHSSNEYVLLTDMYRNLVVEDYRSEGELLRKVIRPADAPNLALQDFPHLAEDARAVVGLLRGTKRQSARGVNLLFYGPPGTGKTEFARRIAADAGLELYEVTCEDGDGDIAGPNERLASLRLALRLLRRRKNCAILFDEVEDLFPSRSVRLFGLSMEMIDSGSSRIGKAWINRLLETNPVPVMWACNRLNGFDPAYTRRYSYHIEFPVPPKSVRRKILDGCTTGMPVSPELLDRLSGDPTLSPGQVRLAATTVALIEPEDGANADALLERALQRSQRAMGRELQARSAANATRFDLSLLNVECSYPLERMLDALTRQPRATLCFFGAPGTGKTALARQIAERLDRPLIARQASDLLSMWLGETEQKLAAMFKEAEAEKAVLFLDEADSFLRDRSGASRSWEVTQVNELLQRMESFNGTFICATNLMEIVDEAALRRFSFKLKFLPLTPEQRDRVFAQEALLEHGLAPTADQELALSRMDGLTLGDVAAVRRQEAVFGERYSPDQFIEQLRIEVLSRRRGKGQPIGFVR